MKLTPHAGKFASYANIIMLDAFSHLLCPKLCWHNRHKIISTPMQLNNGVTQFTALTLPLDGHLSHILSQV